MREAYATDAVRQNNARQTAAAELSDDFRAPQAASPAASQKQLAITVYPVGVKAGMLAVRMITFGRLLTDRCRFIE